MDALRLFPPTLFVGVYVLFALGFYLVLGQSKITLPLRKWAFTHDKLKPLVTLVECPMCLGFWTGAFSALLWFGLPCCMDFPLLPIIVGCVTSATNTMLFVLVDSEETDNGND